MSNFKRHGIERWNGRESLTDDATAATRPTNVILIYFHAELISLDHVKQFFGALVAQYMSERMLQSHLLCDIASQ